MLTLCYGKTCLAEVNAEKTKYVLLSRHQNTGQNHNIIKSRRMRWAGHVERMREKRNAYRILVGKPEGKRPLGRPRRRWVDNIKMDLREIGWGVMG
jgi:hypothetical protein